MRRITLNEKEYLIIKLVYALRAIPSYNKDHNGLRVQYGKFLTITLTSPEEFTGMPLTKYQFEKLITSTFQTYGFEPSGYVSWANTDYRIKGGIAQGRKNLNIIIRRLKRIEKGNDKINF